MPVNWNFVEKYKSLVTYDPFIKVVEREYVMTSQIDKLTVEKKIV